MRLEPTSERVLEDAYRTSDSSYAVYLFHVATYDYAMQFAAKKRVLDLGCGSGYGTAILANVARLTVGVDVAPDAVDYASSRYATDKLAFQTISAGKKLPFADASFDLLTSFQVIEHIEDVPQYLSEARRVLVPGGMFIVATPDRSSRLFHGQKPWNPWHLTEYSSTSLRSVISNVFSDVSILRMGGTKELTEIEISRYHRMRLLSLPFTLPFIPDRIRQFVLKYISANRMNRKATGLTPEIERLTSADVTIGPDMKPSLNLIALARN